MRILIRRLTSLPAASFSKKEVMMELMLSPAAPAFFSSILKIRILEDVNMDWHLPIANSVDDLSCVQAMTRCLTHMMCPSEGGMGSPFISLLSYYVKKFTVNQGVCPKFFKKDITLDSISLSKIINNRYRVRL